MENEDIYGKLQISRIVKNNGESAIGCCVPYMKTHFYSAYSLSLAAPFFKWLQGFFYKLGNFCEFTQKKYTLYEKVAFFNSFYPFGETFS